MPVYKKKGRTGAKGQPIQRVVVWSKNRRHEKLVEGTRKEALAFEARWRVELETTPGLSVERAGVTFSDFCLRRYRPHAELHLRKSTWSVRKYQIVTLLETPLDRGGRTLGDVKLVAFATEDVEAFKLARKAEGRKPRSINNELAVLRAIRTYARRLPVPIGNATIEDLPVVGRGRVTFWNDEQMDMLFESIEVHAPDIMGPVVFLANTGCRKGEAIAGEKTWINLKRGGGERPQVEIPVNDYWQPKDNEPREIPVSDTLLPYLERALTTSGPWLFPCSQTKAEKEAGEPPRRFKCWPKRAFDRARKLAGRCEACERADPAPKGDKDGRRCKDCAPQLRGGPHTLRHTYASHFLAAQPDMFLLAQVLGHSETRTSLLYSHLLPDHMERARNAVNLGPKKGPARLEAQRRWAAKK